MHGVQGQRIAGNFYFDVVIREHLFEKNDNKIKNKREEESTRQETWESVSQAWNDINNGPKVGQAYWKNRN